MIPGGLNPIPAVESADIARRRIKTEETADAHVNPNRSSAVFYLYIPVFMHIVLHIIPIQFVLNSLTADLYGFRIDGYSLVNL